MGRGRQDMSIWVGMGMDRSAVAGYGKGAVGNEATFERGQYGNRIKKLLEPCLKVEREILAVIVFQVVLVWTGYLPVKYHTLTPGI